MLEQYEHRCKKYGISYMIWDGEIALPSPPCTILISIEKVDYISFRTFLKSICSFIARVIVDEAHLILSHASFRPIMSVLGWLGAQHIPICIQTATLPPHLELPMWNMLGVTTSITVRAPTSRPNISIRVILANLDEMMETVKHIYMQAVVRRPDARTLVFCKTTKEVEELSTLLDVPSCHSGLGMLVISALLDRFRRGEIKAIVSTCILGVALDVPGVTYIIHYDYPRNVVDYMQEISRAGRDLSTPMAWSYVVLPKVPAPYEPPTEDVHGCQMIRLCLDQRRYCRRLYLEVFLDGKALSCVMHGPTTHLCDVCQAQLTQPAEQSQGLFPPELQSPILNGLLGKDLHNAQESSLEMYSSGFLSQLQHVKRSTDDVDVERVLFIVHHFEKTCITCWAEDGNANHDHTFYRCSKYYTNEWKEWRASLKFPERMCFQCGFPQAVSFRFLSPFTLGLKQGDRY